jgi:hypothetical protein
MTIDCENSAITGAGGVWMCGIGNRAEDVLVMNGDGFSIIVSGVYSNGAGFVASTTTGNAVINCPITGQRRYHSIGGKAALLVGDGARYTVCDNIMLVDNFMALETGDYADNDQGLYTFFRNITCMKTSEGLAPGAGLHLEGGEDYDDMFIAVENLTVRNMTVGTSVAENSKATYTGKNTLVGCKYAIKSYGVYTPTFENFDIIDCGAGLESTDNEGVINNSTSGIYRNITTTGTLARCSFVNYNGDSGNSVAIPTKVIGCSFDKYVRLSYTNVGSYFMELSQCTFTGTRVDWYNNTGLRVDITDCFFNNSNIVGSRVHRANVGGNCRFYTTDNTKIAIDLSTDNYNTNVENTTFEGYASIGANVTLGFGVKQTSIVTPSTSASMSTNLVINNSASTTSSISLEDGAFSKSVGAGFFFNSGLVAPPSLIGPGVTGSDGPNAFAALEVRSNVKGLIPPRFTTADRASLAPSLGSTEDGLIVEDITLHKFFIWNGSAWQKVVAVSEPVTVTGTSATATTGTIITNNASRVTITLPLNANSQIDDEISVLGKGAGGWKVAQPESGTIIHHLTTSTTGTSGYVQSGAQYDTVTLKKIAANEWTVTNYRGTLTVN